MLILRLLILVSLVLIALSAMAVDFGQRVGDSKWQNVVALAAPVSHGTEEYKIFCSAVLIHPKVVLTAAHCLQEGNLRLSQSELRTRVRGFKVYTGSGEEAGIVQNSLVSIDNAFIHSRYLRDIRGQADIAVVMLSNPIDELKAHITPLALDISLLKNEITRGQSLRIVGFGHSEQLTGRPFQTEEHFGIKHEANLLIEGKTASELMVVAGRAVDSLGLFRPSPREGDSGGPVFFESMDGKAYVAGIVSRSTRFNHGPLGSAFSQVRNWVCWIESVSGEVFRDASEIDYCARDFFSDYSPSSGSFQDLCLNPNLSQAYTLDVLKKMFNISDCLELESKLGAITNINLDATYIHDISVLESFKQLERISIRDNLIQSIEPLRDFKDLRFLDISYNLIRDFSSLRHWENSGGWLIGERRQFNTIVRNDFIKMCQDETTSFEARQTINAIMGLMGFGVRDCVNANYELIRVRDLRFFQSRNLESMEPLRGIHTIERLDLSGQKITDLSFLEDMRDLRSLNLSGNPVKDFTFIALQTKLIHLDLSHTGVRGLEFLSNLRMLRTLDLRGNSNVDLSPIQDRLQSGTLRLIR
jgi:hypothetical protein